MLRPSVIVLMSAALSSSACVTNRIVAEPEDARITVDGKDLGEGGEYEQRGGFSGADVVVEKKGYLTKRVTLPRTEVNPIARWSALAGSTACTVLSAGAACSLAGCLSSRANPRVLAGGLLTAQDPLTSLIAGQAITAIAAPWWMVPTMGCCTLLGSWPLLGLLIPLYFSHSAPVVKVQLEPEEAAPAPPSVPAAQPVERGQP